MNETHGSFSDILTDTSLNVRDICSLLRERITSLHPEFVEVVWPRQGIASYGVGPKKMSEHYAYISIQNNYVNLGFYYGVELTDTEGLLTGNGKNLRHIKIYNIQDAESESVKDLLLLAIENRKNVPAKG